MKKIFSGLFFIIIAFTAVIPFINGVLAEKVFTRGIEEINAMYADTGSDVNLQIIEYDRGFYSSTVKWKANINQTDSLYNISEIIVTDRAQHGFTGVTSQTDLLENDWFAELVHTKLDGTNPFDIKTFYSLTGKIQSTVTINPFTVELGENQCVSKQGRFVAATDHNFKRFTFSGRWEGFSIADTLNFQGVSIDSDMTMITSLVWDGISGFSIETLSLHEEGTQVDIKEVSGAHHLAYDKKGNSLSTGAIYKIGRINNGLDTYKDLSVELNIRKIDADAYENALTAYMDLVTDLIDELSTVQDAPEAVKDIVEKQMIGAGLQMMSVYEQLLKEGLEFTITDIHAQLPQGDIKGNAGIRLDKDITLAQIAPVLHDPERVFDFLSFHSNISLPKELMSDTNALLSPILPGMETGIFIEKGGYLVHKAETRDKKLFLNDIEIHLN